MTVSSGGSGTGGERRRPAFRFERMPARITLDPGLGFYVVTWSKCGESEERRLSASKDPAIWMPSVSAVAELFDRGCVSQDRIIPAAVSVRRAWEAGDRLNLDTEGARNAASFVSAVLSMRADSSEQSFARDVWKAMRSLADEIAMARFVSEPSGSFAEDAVMPVMERAIAESSAEEGFLSWNPQCRRRRLLYAVRKRDATPVVYTLTSLLFDTGSCPLLPMLARRSVRAAAGAESGFFGSVGFSAEKATAFVASALRIMREANESGLPSPSTKMTQQQLADSVSSSSPCPSSSGPGSDACSEDKNRQNGKNGQEVRKDETRKVSNEIRQHDNAEHLPVEHGKHEARQDHA